VARAAIRLLALSDGMNSRRAPSAIRRRDSTARALEISKAHAVADEIVQDALGLTSGSADTNPHDVQNA
jgi:hypothetical protein